jgi:hypothetical protein
MPILRQLTLASLAALAGLAHAADIKVLTAGAFKQVLVAAQPDFERRTGHKLIIDNDTAGALQRRIGGGEAFDLVVSSPASLQPLRQAGKLADEAPPALARVGIGVAVKPGTPVPPLATRRRFPPPAAAGEVDRDDRSGSRWLQRHLPRPAVREVGHRRPGEGQGGAGARRPGGRARDERAGRGGRAPDQRDPGGARRRAGGSAAGRDPELHRVCRGGVGAGEGSAQPRGSCWKRCDRAATCSSRRSQPGKGWEGRRGWILAFAAK